MRFFATKICFEHAKLNGHEFEHEKEHAEVIYNYIREFCLDEGIKAYERHCKVNVLLVDPDDIFCLFRTPRFQATITTEIFIGKPTIIDCKTSSGKKCDPSFVRNISLSDYWVDIRDMFTEYKIMVLREAYNPAAYGGNIEL